MVAGRIKANGKSVEALYRELRERAELADILRMMLEEAESLFPGYGMTFVVGALGKVAWSEIHGLTADD